MLEIHTAMGKLNISWLSEVYSESIKLQAENYSYSSENARILESQQDFYWSLQAFYRQKGAFYGVWNPGDGYKAALRCEPYRDGLLLEGVETAPQSRRKGYAKDLMRAVIAYLRLSGCKKLYSHVHKGNEASLKLHECCGFTIISDHAVYIDGSADYKSYTFVCQLSDE